MNIETRRHAKPAAVSGCWRPDAAAQESAQTGPPRAGRVEPVALNERHAAPLAVVPARGGAASAPGRHVRCSGPTAGSAAVPQLLTRDARAAPDARLIGTQGRSTRP